MNINVVNLWVLGASMGYAIGNLPGAAVGLMVASGIVFLFNILVK